MHIAFLDSVAHDASMDHFTTTLGRWKIDKLFETEVAVTTQFLFPEWGDASPPDPLVLSIHTMVLRDGQQTILIDTAAGNGKHRPETPFLNNLNTPYISGLATLGIAPETVDFVLFTHLHVDHVGWNTQQHDGVWRPTFPNARHLCTSRELNAYTDSSILGPENNHALAYADSVLPVRQAGLIDTVVADGREVLPGISFLSTPGHSVDHSVIRLDDCAEVALFIGDLMHNPLQVARPDLSSVFCSDPAQARESRANILALAADQNALVFPSHFDGSSAGRVLRQDSNYIWEWA